MIVDARNRIGGRVWTIREPFAERQHGEAGGDMIDDGQHEIRNLAQEMGLKLTRILRGGFGYAGPDPSGRTRIVPRSAARGWERLAEALAPLTWPYSLAEQRWDSPIAADLARQSVARWLDDAKADEELRARRDRSSRLLSGGSRRVVAHRPCRSVRREHAAGDWKTYASRAATIAWQRRWPRRSDRGRLSTEVVADVAPCGRASV
jgi:monoamine oxidase